MAEPQFSFENAPTIGADEGVDVVDDGSEDGFDWRTMAVEVKTELRKALSNIAEAKGKEFGIHTASNFVDPQIRIRGRNIGTPLSEKDGKFLMEVRAEASSSLNSSGEVTKRTWQFRPGDFAINNLQWDSYMEQFVRQVAVDLGLNQEDPGIRISLEGMTLLEKGAISKTIGKASKSPSSLGTLLVQLPSSHSGGSTQVWKEGGPVMLLDTEGKENAFLWWSSAVDVLHLPVVTGLRWVLSYQIECSDFNSPISPLVPDTSNIQRILNAYNNQREFCDERIVDVPRILILRLANEYPEANLGFHSLKGGDFKKTLALHHACAKSKAYLFLASVEVKRVGCTDFDFEDIPYQKHRISRDAEEDFHLTNICDAEGNPVRQRLRADGDMFVDLGSFARIYPDQEDWMDNPEQGTLTQFYPEGETVQVARTLTHWYRRPVVVIVTDPELMEFLGLDGQLDVSDPPLPACRHVTRMVMRGTAPEAYRKGLGRFCERVITLHKSRSTRQTPEQGTLFDKSLLRELVFAASALENNELCVRALEAFHIWDDASLSIVGNMIAKHGFVHFLHTFEQHFAEEEELSALVMPLIVVLTQSTTEELSDISIDIGRNSGLTDWMVHIIDKRLHKMIKARTALHYGDSLAIGMFYNFVGPEDYLGLWKKGILDLLTQNASKTLIVACTINRLCDCIEVNHDKPIETECDWFKHLIIRMSEDINIFSGIPDMAQCMADNDFQPGEEYVTFVNHCRQMGFSTPYQRFLIAIEGQAMSADPEDFQSFFLPCMHWLINGNRRKPIPKDEYRDIFRGVLRSFVWICVGLRPKEDLDCWRRETLSCDCKLCCTINDFLSDRQLRTASFDLSSAGLDHFTFMAECGDLKHVSYDVRRKVMGRKLRMTKKALPEQSLLADWRERRRNASEMLNGFFRRRIPELKELLGDSYEDIFNMRMLETVPSIEPNAVSTAPGLMSSNPSRNVLGSSSTKRKASEMEADDPE